VLTSTQPGQKGDPENDPPIDPADEALGRSKGGFSTRLHVRCEGKGKPVVFELTPGEQHECVVFERLMEGGAIKKSGRGRPRRLPFRVAANKAYSTKRIRGYLARRGIGITIPRKRNEKHRGKFDKEAYRKRNRVERLINRLKQYRRIATRYEKRAANYKACLLVAAILLQLSLAVRFWSVIGKTHLLPNHLYL